MSAAVLPDYVRRLMVTQERFDALVAIVLDLVAALRDHNHGVSGDSSYGGSTYGPDYSCCMEFDDIKKRLDEMTIPPALSDPAPAPRDGDGHG